jgi:ribonuclease P protein component
VVRNRLKRQLRTIVYGGRFPLRLGLDMVVVIHPIRIPAATDSLRTELTGLCKRAGALA